MHSTVPKRRQPKPAKYRIDWDRTRKTSEGELMTKLAAFAGGPPPSERDR